MFDIDIYCQRLKEALSARFGEDFCYMGLQGSNLRGEATDSSDIDIMVILETLSTKTMKEYREIIEGLGDFERSCGFICSREDMKMWNPLETCQLLYTTKDLHGRLADFLSPWRVEDEINYIKMSLNNLYHAACHTFIHRDEQKIAKSQVPLYKGAYFVLQNTHFLETYLENPVTAEFILKKSRLTEKLKGTDKVIMETLARLLAGETVDTQEACELFVSWCQQKLKWAHEMAQLTAEVG